MSKGTISLCPLSASHGLSVEMDQVQQPTLANGTNTSPHHLPGTGDPGAKTLCCVKVAVLLLETALYPKPGSFAASDTKPKILSRTRCYTCLTPAMRLWGNMVPCCLLHHFGQDQDISLGFSIKHDSRACGSWGWELRTARP